MTLSHDRDDDDGDAEDDDFGDDAGPSPEELARIRQAGPQAEAAVDALVLRHCGPAFAPVADVVGAALDAFEAAHPQLPYVYLQMRLADLARRGVVQVQGDPMSLRRAQVRLAALPGKDAA